MAALMIDSPWAIGMILVAVLVLFGGSRLAGLGKGAGRAIKEFKDETSGMLDSDEPDVDTAAKDQNVATRTGEQS